MDMNDLQVRLTKVFRALFSSLYLILIILTIPLSFDVGGVECGLAFSFTTCTLYFVLTTIQLVTRKNRYVRWISLLYYVQHLLIPSLLTLFLSYYSSKHKPHTLTIIDLWRQFIINSTPIFTILEGFCSLLLIQAIGQTINWLIVYKSDSWLIVSLVGSGSTITAALYFLYRIYVFPFTIDIVSASLLGSLLTMTVGLGLFGIVSGKGSMIESSLLFAYIVRCIYETFPILSEGASKALTALFTQTTYNLKQEIPILPPQILSRLLQLVPFLASNLPGSFKTIWEFLLMAIQKLTLPLLLNLAYRIGVFYAATKIIPSLYHGVIYPSLSPPRTPSQTRSRLVSTSPNIIVSEASDGDNNENVEKKNEESSTSEQSSHTAPFRLAPPNREPPSTLIKFIYAYSPCIVIAVYTHLMMLYNGELGTELKIWGFWDSSYPSNMTIVVHPWQFWNWVNMATTILLYAAELMGNSGESGGAALTSHWSVE
ncbi:uncharacterized protein PRCAT00005191001 [Priceomyces carsonii]|uniref:uncharacterized protein n=1 Tax=Priceomyces carsonii TaxID=28549 RepID=UPI002ED7B2AD|nr:unnamed protein product [Priceomyces carsonii]